MSMLLAAWERFWFHPRPAVDLGAARAAFATLVLLHYGGTGISAWGDVDGVFWTPVLAFEILGLPRLDSPELSALEFAWTAALALLAVGLFTRPAAIVSFGLSFYLLGLPQSMGKIHHFDGIVVIVLGVLAVSRCGDAFSLDARRRRRAGAPAPAASPEYGWPVRLVRVALAAVFLGAGIAKVRYGGWAWVASDHVRYSILGTVHVGGNSPPWTDLGVAVARHGDLVRALAAATVAIELAYPAALFSRRAALVLVPTALAMVVGIRALMGPSFGPLVAAHVFWIPWSVVLARRSVPNGADRPARSRV